MRKILLSLAIAGATLIMSGCGDEPRQQQVYQEPVQPQQYQQGYAPAPQQVVHHYDNDNSGNDMVTGMVAGAVLSNMMNNNGGNNGGSSHTTVNKTVVNKTYVGNNPTTPSKTSGFNSMSKNTDKYKQQPSTYGLDKKETAKYRTGSVKPTGVEKAKYRTKTVNPYKQQTAKYRPTTKKSSSWGFGGSSSKVKYRKKR